MASAPSRAEVERFLEVYESEGGNAAATARVLGMNPSTAVLWTKRAEEWLAQSSEHTTTVDEGENERKKDETIGDRRSIHMVTHEDLVTIDDVVKHCKIDLTEWEVYKCKITSHKQGQTDADKNPRIVSMVNVSLELRRRKPNDPQRAKREVMDMLAKHAPRIVAPKWSRRKKRGELMLEISVPDIHIGKLADADETGEDYNLEIARSLYLKAHEHIITQACERYEIGHIVNVPSNDLMHFAGSRYATTRGTRQDAAGIWQRVYRTARETAVDGVLMCREVAPVRVITHPDNHAHDEAFYLGDALWCYFHKDKHADVDCSPAPYKYHRHGDCLIGFGHGDKSSYERLQNEMIRANPMDYGACKIKEWHLGHLHKQMLRENQEGDVMYRRLPSLSGTDSWHASEGYRSMKRAMGFVWSHEALEAIIYYTPTAKEYAA